MAKILIVEDDADMNDILSGTLTELGYEVAAVFNGPKAIEHCRTHPVDLVVTDVRLPGMDGVEALSEIRKIQPKLKCIVITGYASVDTPVRAIRLNVDDYLFKPFSLQYLANSVNRVLEGSAEKKSRWALFQKVFSILGPSKDRVLEKLVLQREDAFRGFYVGVRSNSVDIAAAAAVYSRLEYLEKKFRAHLNSSDLDVAKIQALNQNYAELQERLWDYDFRLDFVDSSGEEVPMDQFQQLFDGIKGSDVGLEELQYAPLLRTSPEERFETLPEMLEFKKKLWSNL